MLLCGRRGVGLRREADELCSSCARCEWLCESTVCCVCVTCAGVSVCRRQCSVVACSVQWTAALRWYLSAAVRRCVDRSVLSRAQWSVAAARTALCGHASFVRFLVLPARTPPGTSCSATAHRTGQRRHATDQTNEMASLSDALALHHCAPRCRRLRTGCGHSTHMPHRRVALEAGQWSAAVVSVMTISRQTDRSTERRRTEAGR